MDPHTNKTVPIENPLLPPASPLSSLIAFVAITLTLIWWKIQESYKAYTKPESSHSTTTVEQASVFTPIRHGLSYAMGWVDAVGFIHALGNSTRRPILSITFNLPRLTLGFPIPSLLFRSPNLNSKPKIKLEPEENGKPNLPPPPRRPGVRLRLHLAKPSIETLLSRNTKSLSLARFASWAFYKPIFNLSNNVITEMHDFDTQAQFNSYFIHPEKGRLVMSKALVYLSSLFTPTNITETRERAVKRVRINAYIFEISAGTTAHAIWGSLNPYFSRDAHSGQWRATQTWHRFYDFQGCFQDLYRPFPSLTARKAWGLKNDLLRGMKEWQINHQAQKTAPGDAVGDGEDTIKGQENGIVLNDNIHHRVNLISNQVNPTNWVHDNDYYAVQVVTSLAILSTIGNISTWLVRYLFADPDLLAKVREEVNALVLHDPEPKTGASNFPNPISI